MKNNERFPPDEAAGNAIGTLLLAALFAWMWWNTGIILFATADLSAAIGLAAASMYFAHEWYRFHHPHQPR
jgi:hypothetical protein